MFLFYSTLCLIVLPMNLPFDQVTAAGLEFSYAGRPGIVIASALSVSSDRNQVFRVPMRDAQIQSSSTGHYPWSIDGTSSTLVYIKNTTNNQQRFTMQVGYDDGAYTLGIRTIEPAQTLAYDIRDLRDKQVADPNGKVIPRDATRGQVHWSVKGKETKSLIGRVEQVDLGKGLSMTAACGVCCPDSYYSSWLTPGSVTGYIGDTTQFTPYEQDKDCTGYYLVPFPLCPSCLGGRGRAMTPLSQQSIALGLQRLLE